MVIVRLCRIPVKPYYQPKFHKDFLSLDTVSNLLFVVPVVGLLLLRDRNNAVFK